MKKQYNHFKVALVLLSTFFVMLGIHSCDETDFTIIPDEREAPIITAIEPNRSDIGTTVNLIGTNFSLVPSNNRVRFNGVPATVTGATATTLTVTVPEGTTDGPVSLTIAQLTADGPVFTVVATPTITDLRRLKSRQHQRPN